MQKKKLLTHSFMALNLLFLLFQKIVAPYIAELSPSETGIKAMETTEYPQKSLVSYQPKTNRATGLVTPFAALAECASQLLEKEYPSKTTCHICFKKLSPSSLNRHINLHTQEKIYPCNYCPKVFLDSSGRNKHEKQHNPQEKKYICETCGKRFDILSKKTAHERTHTGGKLYQCSYCPKCFPHPSSKNRHERIHTGEKPYQCVYCGKDYSDSSCRNQHQLKCQHTHRIALFNPKKLGSRPKGFDMVRACSSKGD